MKVRLDLRTCLCQWDRGELNLLRVGLASQQKCLPFASILAGPFFRPPPTCWVFLRVFSLTSTNAKMASLTSAISMIILQAVRNVSAKLQAQALEPKRPTCYVGSSDGTTFYRCALSMFKEGGTNSKKDEPPN